jgi:hypothetical protein
MCPMGCGRRSFSIDKSQPQKAWQT